MKLRFTDDAERQAENEDNWWREARKKSPELFSQELAAMTAHLLIMPKSGRVFTVVDGVEIRRVVLQATRYHLYYSFDEPEQMITVHHVWGAQRKDTSRF